jgi:hypothetical protein
LVKLLLCAVVGVLLGLIFLTVVFLLGALMSDKDDEADY